MNHIENSPVSLVELNGQIRKAIKSSFGAIWLITEISEMTVNYSGHCYLEFIQKENESEKIIARARGTIWNQNFRIIKQYFETSAGRPFSKGIKVMVKVTVEFHEVYGLSLNVTDIEPTYTLGEIALRKQRIIEKLKAEGIIDKNKTVELPIIPNKIAVISSITAAGFEDFTDQLINNTSGYRFYLKLFPAVMQGNETENSIINQLKRIYTYHNLFDVVVIIRGGGSQADLDCFNNYNLASAVAHFPLPVLTGIGHEQDDSVVDIVAHTRLKTPTAVAEYLIDRLNNAENDLNEVEEKIISNSQEIISLKKTLIKEMVYKLNNNLQKQISAENKSISFITSVYYSLLKNNFYRIRLSLGKAGILLSQKTRGVIARKRNELYFFNKQLVSDSKYSLDKAGSTLILNEQKLELSDPANILKKGFSLTFFQGELVTDSEQLSAGDEIETIFTKGKSKSIIK